MSVQAMDLTRDVPRSPFEELRGYSWLPRMIDKARAMYAGTLGDYSPYPCPGDRLFLSHFALDPAPLGDLIKGGASDDEILAYVQAHAKGGEAAVQAFRANQRQPATGFVGLALKFFRWKNRQAILARHPGLDLSKLDSFPKMLAAEEGHAVVGL